MFYVIGVAHRVQCKQKGSADPDAQKELRNCISGAVAQFKPVLIAEEFSEYALEMVSKDRGAEQESITKVITASCNVKHRFCDADGEARAKMGYVEGSEMALRIAMTDDTGLSNQEVNSRGFAIEVAKYWPLREQFWLDQLHDVVDKDVVFICGDVHVESFAELLKKNGIDATIIARHIGVTERDDEFWRRITSYLESHPAIRE